MLRFVTFCNLIGPAKILARATETCPKWPDVLSTHRISGPRNRGQCTCRPHCGEIQGEGVDGGGTNSPSKWNPVYANTYMWVLSETSSLRLINNCLPPSLNNGFPCKLPGTRANNNLLCHFKSILWTHSLHHTWLTVTACHGWMEELMGTHHLLLLSPSSVQLEHVPQLLMENLSAPWQEWWRRCPVVCERMTSCWNELTPFCTMHAAGTKQLITYS